MLFHQIGLQLLFDEALSLGDGTEEERLTGEVIDVMRYYGIGEVDVVVEQASLT